MKKNLIPLFLILAVVFILSCGSFSQSQSIDSPAPNADVIPTQASNLEPANSPVFQSGDLIFETDFSDIDTWDIVTNNDISNYTAETRGNGLYVEVPDASDYWYAYLPMDSTSDVRIEADVELVGGTNYTYITLTCRSGEDGEYVFFLDTGGYYQIGKYDFRNDNPYEKLANGGSTKIKVAKNPNHMTVICQGSTLSFSINGEEVASVNDSTFDSGVVGIGVQTFDNPKSQVEFHTLEVSVP